VDIHKHLQSNTMNYKQRVKGSSHKFHNVLTALPIPVETRRQH